MFDSPRLEEILQAELVAGNRVVEDGPGWGQMARLVLLAGPFRTPRPGMESGLDFRAVNDPHYWLAEIEDPATREVLACRF